MPTGLHVVLGAGPVGVWTARALLDSGADVRVVNRSGVRPALLPPEAELVVADARQPADVVAAVQGAAVIYQALNPRYHRWPEEFPTLQAGVLQAAEQLGARYVSIDNLYMYGRVAGPIRPDTPQRPHTVKGRLRAAMARDVLAAHHAGRVAAAVLRSADYYGPGVTASALGDRTFPPLLAGKAASVLGSADVPHSFAFIADVGRAAATLGTRAKALGRVWFTPHAPARTQREMLAPAFAYAGVKPRVRVMGARMMRLGGLFVPEARESVEMMYEFTEPFVVDSSETEQAFELAPTAVEDGMRATVDWYRKRT
jgi:nucleoside-diphosphate-sugar epimerase